MTGYGTPPSSEAIADKDVTETFSESDVTVSGGGIITSNDRVELTSGTENYFSSFAEDFSGSGEWAGSTFSVNGTLDATFTVTVANNTSQTSMTDFRIKNLDDGTIVSKETGLSVSPGNSYSHSVTGLQEGVEYAMQGYSSEHTQDTDSSFGGSGALVNIGTGVVRSSTKKNRKYFFEDFTVDGAFMSTTTTVEWPKPNDVYRWDAATFQRNQDGETAQVDIQEDDGSGWTTIATNIGRGEDITAAPDSQVRLVINLDRASDTNNPTMDLLSRRWVL